MDSSHEDVSGRFAIVADGVTKDFGGKKGVPLTRALDDVSIAIPAGKMVAVVGPSGCGKSTLLFCLAGLDKPTQGAVTVLDQPLGALSDSSIARLYRDRIGFVFQTYNLVPSLPARENVVLPARLARRKADLQAADAALESVGMISRSGSRTATLSSGEQQRTALARILVKNPPLILADEPTGALDSPTAATVLGRLRALADGTRTVVMVTHDLNAASVADQVLVMRDGRIHFVVDEPTPEKLLAAMEAAPARSAA